MRQAFNLGIDVCVFLRHHRLNDTDPVLVINTLAVGFA